MKLGLSLPNNQGVAHVRDLITLAIDAERAGYHSVWVSEHLWHSSYVAQRLGDRPYHDPLTVLSAIAPLTTSIRLGTSVLVLPWHHPVRLAKTIASLDDLSQGRVDCGVGVAITADEFENLGIDFSTRGRRTDDMLAAMRALWTQDFPHHDSDFYRFSGMRFEPKPVQEPLPIHIGGGSPAALRRVATFGDGWHALGQSPSSMASGLQKLSAACARAGRDVGSLHISVRVSTDVLTEPFDKPISERKTLRGTESEIKATIDAFEDAGVDELIIDANTPDLAKTRAIMETVSGLLTSTSQVAPG